MRINKYLSTCGVASRRKSDDIIKSGAVRINGKVCTELGTDINPEYDEVTVHSKPVQLVQKFVYYKLNKPKGFVSTTSDDKHRKTVIDLMRGVKSRIFPIGRLDYDTEGLILMTNDGDLANILTSPKKEISKTYIVKISQELDDDEIKYLKQGVNINGYVTKPCNIDVIEHTDEGTRLQITIYEGKNRQIRRMFESIGKTITYLKRISIGDICLGGLSRGEYQPLNKKEMEYIKSIK